ncbi:MAG: hypothetical protein ACP5NS_01055 [Candidatus Pacearchaeota archaeon]
MRHKLDHGVRVSLSGKPVLDLIVTSVMGPSTARDVSVRITKDRVDSTQTIQYGKKVNLTGDVTVSVSTYRMRSGQRAYLHYDTGPYRLESI